VLSLLASLTVGGGHHLQHAEAGSKLISIAGRNDQLAL
jgi:hypothetical protein